MKVVLFCGGLGTRLREHAETIPKPLATVGPRPIIWHLMKYYAHFGHTEFVLCLGYRGDLIREFFAEDAGIPRDWTVHFVESGLEATIADRLLAARSLVDRDPMFLANYSDGLSDLPLPAYLDACAAHGAIGAFAAVRISQSYHMVSVAETGRVTALTPARDADVWINGGFFAFRPEIFDYVHAGEELVEAPFQRLMADGRLYAFKHQGFWAAVDTYKDKVSLDRRHEQGDAPWEVWTR